MKFGFCQLADVHVNNCNNIGSKLIVGEKWCPTPTHTFQLKRLWCLKKETQSNKNIGAFLWMRPGCNDLEPWLPSKNHGSRPRTNGSRSKTMTPVARLIDYISLNTPLENMLYTTIKGYWVSLWPGFLRDCFFSQYKRVKRNIVAAFDVYLSPRCFDLSPQP